MKNSAAFALFSLCLLVIFSLLFIENNFGRTDFSLIMSYLNTTKINVSGRFEQLYVRRALLPAIAAALFFWLAVPAVLSWKDFGKGKVRPVLLSVSFLGAVIYLSAGTGFFHFLKLRQEYTPFFEKEYAAPQTIAFHVPGKPKNLVLIVLESMEIMYRDENTFSKNLLPKLSRRFAGKNAVSFDGYYQLRSTNNTVLALVGMYCGLPFQNSLKTMNKFTCLPDILKQNGYRNYFLSSDALSYSGKDVFLKNHSFDGLYGARELMKTPQDRGHDAFDFSVKDRVLFEAAKQKITEAVKEKSPFFVTLLTLDTHDPAGYRDPQCAADFQDMRDSVACTDTLADGLIAWMEKQDFYRDTAVVLIGDHISRRNSVDYMINDRTPPAEVLNLFLNSSKQPNENKRKYTSIDLAPTFLEMLGFSFQDGRFGMGVSLLSDTPTLIEKYGMSTVDTETLKPSRLYE